MRICRGSTTNPIPGRISHSWVTRDVGMALALATVRAFRKVSPSSTQFSSKILSTRELTRNSPPIVDIPSISGFS